MKDKSGNIIYIGKAKNLKNRVTSYFRENADHLPKVAKMVSNVYDYDFIVTNTELEALLLECSLIKKHQPKYNILLKDDKGYNYIKITKEPYPRISSVFQNNTDDTFIGPFMSSFITKQTVNEANKIFKLPTCSKKFPRDFNKTRPCLNFYINECIGVCKGKISEKEYGVILNEALEHMKSGSEKSIEKLTNEMQIASDNYNFEQAAILRDRINAIKKSIEKQDVVEINHQNVDVIAVSENAEHQVASVLMYRGGVLFDKSDFLMGEKEDRNSVYSSFVTQFYKNEKKIPKEIFLSDEIEEVELLEGYLREISKRSVKIKTPKIGATLRLCQLARENAAEYLAVKVKRTGKEITALDELAKILALKETPKYIECYDISNLASSAMVAGMVVFENGRPLKKAYKRFKIKETSIQNDYASMSEVLKRRFLRYFEGDDEGFKRLPDLIFLDGGKGHVSTIRPMLMEMGINVPVYGLVKDSKHKTRAIATDGKEISINTVKSAFYLLTNIQDEVHRYAVSYMKSVHKKESYEMSLTSVNGIGEKKAQKLILFYKTKEAMKKASVEEIRKVVGVNEEIAKELYEFIQNSL